eukprot:419710-Rhodomonas_salina.1
MDRGSGSVSMKAKRVRGSRRTSKDSESVSMKAKDVQGVHGEEVEGEGECAPGSKAKTPRRGGRRTAPSDAGRVSKLERKESKRGGTRRGTR